MRLIKSAWVYGAPLPAKPTELMLEQVEQHAFVDPASVQKSAIGFVANTSTGELIAEFEGGWAVTVRLDEKILPAAAVSKAVDEKVAEVEARDGRKVYRKEKLSIKDDVVATMLGRAFTKSTYVHVFYYSASSLLVVAAASNKTAIEVLGLMREAFGTLKSQALRIESLSAVLTAGLRRYVDAGDEDLGPFALGGYLQLQNDLNEDRMAVAAGGDETIALDSISEPLMNGYRVTAISLHGPGASFKLTADQAFKKIVFGEPGEEPDYEDIAQLWRHEAAVQVMLLCDQVKLLLELAGSMFPVFEEPA